MQSKFCHLAEIFRAHLLISFPLPLSFRELITSHPANLGTVLNCVVNNELGQFRSHSNMALISMMLYTWADEAAKVRPALTYPEREGEREGERRHGGV